MSVVVGTRFKSPDRRGGSQSVAPASASGTSNKSPYLSPVIRASISPTKSHTARASKANTGSSIFKAPATSTKPSASSSEAAETSATAAVSSSASASASAPTTSRQTKPTAKKYKYCVLSGNEPSLIRESLGQRGWWVEAKASERWDFWWGGNGQKFNFDDLITGGGGSGSGSGGGISSSGGGLSRMTSGVGGTSGSGSKGSDPSSQRIANRLPEHRQLCTKSGLAANLAEILKKSRKKDRESGGSNGSSVSWIPETYIIEGGKGKSKPGTSYDPNVERFMNSFKAHATTSIAAATSSASTATASVSTTTTSAAAAAADNADEGAEKAATVDEKKAATGGDGRGSAAGRAWIVKPTNMNRGNGIEIFDNAKELLKFIDGRKAGSKWIVQKYIDDPLLVQGRKFDIRAYALVVPAAACPGGAAASPDGGVYLHREAYIRTSGVPFKPDDLKDKASHLTNDAVQKLSPETYHAFEDHCKLSLEELQRQLLADSSISDPDFVSKRVWPAMRDCVESLFGATLAALNPGRRRHCFELLGLDFMLDRSGRLYLIEVNTSPALFRAGAYLADLLPRVVEELVQKVLDPIFPNPAGGGGGVSSSGEEKGEGLENGGEQKKGDATIQLLDGFVRVI